MEELKTNNYLKGIVLNLPESPGIYQYLNAEGTIIYVGKAKNLKRRVSSYFNREHPNGKTRVLVSKIADIRYIVVKTEEATGLICAGIFLGSIKAKGYTEYKDQKNILVRAIGVAFIILVVVYGGLCWLGACGTPYFAADMDSTALLNGLVQKLAGYGGIVVLAVAVIFACFTTAAGMIATASDWVLEWTRYRRNI